MYHVDNFEITFFWPFLDINHNSYNSNSNSTCNSSTYWYADANTWISFTVSCNNKFFLR